MPKVKTWKEGDPTAPAFPEDFEVTHKAVLQVTDIKTNRNKYYAIELHRASQHSQELFRVFTHYGRTDDLDSAPDAGQKECRYFASLIEAQRNYESLYRAKTSPSKGYKEVSLASSRIGSSKARGTSSGHIDDATIRQAAAREAEAEADAKGNAGAEKPPPPPPPPEPPSWRSKLKRFVGLADEAEDAPVATLGPDGLHPKVAELVEYIYAEATSALTSSVAVKITAQGIETPLGILTLGQIQKGEEILQALYALFQKRRRKREQLEELSGEFYTVIPHRIGRSRAAISAAVIDSLEAFEQKQETLQLMKDMLQVNGEDNVLYHSQNHAQYEALRCRIEALEPRSVAYREIADYVVKSQVKSKSIRVVGVFSVCRDVERKAFRRELDDQRMMFHGSRVANWVGILSRGIVLPKIAVSMGVNRTDAGWLGNGIYFGDAACTSAFYTSPGRKGTRLMAVARVALGRIKEFTKITYGLTGPPSGYDSCHGVRNSRGRRSQFADDEYVVYDGKQQQLEYLVELRA